nr:hypothetical protein [Tanacetum cinerariifolium]
MEDCHLGLLEVVGMVEVYYPGGFGGYLMGKKRRKKACEFGREKGMHSASDITSKESTLQLVYDVLRLTPFYKAFLVTADVPELYMQEFWATATVHHHSIRFKMNNKKCIFNLEYFREMLYICPRLPNQTFDELPFEDEILAFLRYLGHSGEIRKITDAQIIWGMYHKKNVDFAYLLWEDFVYQVEHKDAKKSNEMYYPRFTNVIIHFFMTKDPSIPRRNKVNWHYVRDDQMFTTIKLVSRHLNTQQFGAILPIELTNEDIRNSAAYKEYYAIASGVAPPKTKASVMKTQSSSDTTITPPTAAGTRLSTLAKGKQPAKSSKEKGLSVLSEVAMTEAEQMKLATKRSLQQTHTSQASGSGADEGTGILPGVLDVLTDESDEEISWKSSDEDDDDEVDERSDDQEDEEDQDDDDDDDDDQDDNDDDQDTDNDGDDFTPENSDDEGNDDASLGMNIGGKEGHDSEDDDEELYRPQAENEDFINKLDENIQKIIKEQIKEQVKVQVSKILPKIKKTVNEQLEAKVLTRSSNSSKTSYVVAADLSKMELKKILIEKMESNKSIHQLDEQRNIYKALVDAYESEEPIQTTQDLEEPSHQEFETGDVDDQPITKASQHPEWFQKQKKPLTPDHAWNKTLPATHESIQP